MKHTQVEETWINSNSSRNSGIDETYHPQWEQIEGSYLFGCITIYIKTIAAE